MKFQLTLLILTTDIHLSSGDSEAPRLQFADPVAEKLDTVVRSWCLAKDHIIFKLVSNVLEFLLYDYSKGRKIQMGTNSGALGQITSSTW